MQNDNVINANEQVNDIQNGIQKEVLGLILTVSQQWWPSWSCDQHHVIRFSFPLYLKAFIQNLVQIGTVVSEKIQFEFLYVHNLGPRSRNDFDLQYSHIF